MNAARHAPATGTYASVADVVYNGTVLAGSGEAAASFEACAIKCSRNVTCSGFNWCDKEVRRQRRRGRSCAREAAPTDSPAAAACASHTTSK